MLCKILSANDITTFYTKEETLVSLSTQTILFLFSDHNSYSFPTALRELGRNSHEKAAFLYLLVEMHRYNLVLNKPIYNEDLSACIKEFDAIDAAAQELFEDKQRLGKGSFEKIFGSKYPARISHTQVLGDPLLRALNALPPIKKLTITYSFIEAGLEQYPLGQSLRSLPVKQQLVFTINELTEVLQPILAKTKYAQYLQLSGLEQVVFIRIPVN